MAETHARTPAIAEQARVATEIYGLLLRGVALDDASMLRLSTAYPSAAALAFQFALRSRATLQVPGSIGATQSPNAQPPATSSDGRAIIRRVHVMSFARMCGWAGLLLATLNLAIAGSMAICVRMLREDYPDIVHVAETVLSGGPSLRLYRRLSGFLEVHILAADLLAIFFFPLGSSMTALVIGVVFASFINICLEAAGGLLVYLQR